MNIDKSLFRRELDLNLKKKRENILINIIKKGKLDLFKKEFNSNLNINFKEDYFMIYGDDSKFKKDYSTIYEFIFYYSIKYNKFNIFEYIFNTYKDNINDNLLVRYSIIFCNYNILKYVLEYKNKNDNYENIDYENIEYEYADFKLGNKIKECIEEKGKCEFYAEV